MPSLLSTEPPSGILFSEGRDQKVLSLGPWEPASPMPLRHEGSDQQVGVAFSGRRQEQLKTWGSAIPCPVPRPALAPASLEHAWVGQAKDSTGLDCAQTR